MLHYGFGAMNVAMLRQFGTIRNDKAGCSLMENRQS